MQIEFIRLIDELFKGIPQSRETLELKEEIVQNLMEKYNDLLAEGKEKQAAFDIAAASIGDVNELIEELLPHAPEPEEPFSYEAETGVPEPEARDYAEMYTARLAGLSGRQRSAAMTALAVMLYILCPVPVILFGGGFGLALLFMCIATATGVIIYGGMTRPRRDERSERGVCEMTRRQIAGMTALSVMLYIVCPAPAVLFGGRLGPSLLLVSIAVATWLIIFSGMTRPRKGESYPDASYGAYSPEARRQQAAAITSAAVMLFILCPMPVVFFDSAFGVALMFFMIAGGVGMLVYYGMMKPKRGEIVEGAAYHHEADYRQWKRERRKSEKAAGSSIGLLTLAVYFIVSFQTGAWHITWVIFIVGAAVRNIIRALADMRRGEVS